MTSLRLRARRCIAAHTNRQVPLRRGTDCAWAFGARCHTLWVFVPGIVPTCCRTCATLPTDEYSAIMPSHVPWMRLRSRDSNLDFRDLNPRPSTAWALEPARTAQDALVDDAAARAARDVG